MWCGRGIWGEIFSATFSWWGRYCSKFTPPPFGHLLPAEGAGWRALNSIRFPTALQPDTSSGWRRPKRGGGGKTRIFKRRSWLSSRPSLQLSSQPSLPPSSPLSSSGFFHACLFCPFSNQRNSLVQCDAFRRHFLGDGGIDFAVFDIGAIAPTHDLDLATLRMLTQVRARHRACHGLKDPCPLFCQHDQPRG